MRTRTASAPAYRRAFMSDSLTMKYAAELDVVRQIPDRDVERHRRLGSDEQRLDGATEPALGQCHRM